ncbi:MAG: 4-hydroxy-tetrahydrodipicolinate reductase [Candidatus Omnitrophica bacterium]|nr:4-hydroxy-tetrahydrodipicolinate reductase [Candidatus Omnitrophota bacterium]
MLRLGVSGVCGKMGKRIAALALDDPKIKLTAALEKDGTDFVGKDLGVVLGKKKMGLTINADLDDIHSKIDVLIEFSSPQATLAHLEAARKQKIAMVIGTTGMDADGEKKIKAASKKIPIVFSPNMAVGMNVLFNIVKEAASVLGDSCDIRIDETHHVHKKDAPSGTAKMIVKVVEAACGKHLPVEVFREGEVIGNHGIIFENKYEKLEIRHDAKSRDVLADGAIKAAKFLSGKKSGLYGMADVLALKK